MASTTATSTIKVWAKINGNEPEKVELRSDADVDDLKNELFTSNKEEKRRHYGVFNGSRLSSSTRVPHDTTCERPISFFKIDENTSEIVSDDPDLTRVMAADLNTEPVREILNTTFTTSRVQSNMDTERSINTSVNHVPLHLVDTIHYKNGDKYVGEVNAKGEPNGKGTMNWKNGRRYEGYWKSGKKDGQGTEYGANGAVNYSGEWKDDVATSTYDDDN